MMFLLVVNPSEIRADSINIAIKQSKVFVF